jgi:hypothetical protein
MTFHTVRAVLRRLFSRLFSRLFTRSVSGRSLDRGTMSAQWVAAQRAAVAR